MILNRVALTGLALLLVGKVAMAAQGIVIMERSTVNGASETHQIQITQQKMRADLAGPNGPTTVVFDGAKQVLYMINPARKSYSEMTKADADQMGAQLSGAMAQMQEAMKNLPPEQRAQMEAMMKGRGMPPGMMAAAAKPTYRKGATRQVGKWTCDVYDIMVNDQRTGELCTVSAQTLGFTAADFAVSQQLAAFMKSMLPGSEALFQMGGAAEGFPGVPVRRVATVLGRETISEMTSVTRQEIADALFEVPAGFTKEAFGGGLGRGRGQ
jgi:hypothetical protein